MGIAGQSGATASAAFDDDSLAAFPAQLDALRDASRALVDAPTREAAAKAAAELDAAVASGAYGDILKALAPAIGNVIDRAWRYDADWSAVRTDLTALADGTKSPEDLMDASIHYLRAAGAAQQLRAPEQAEFDALRLAGDLLDVDVDRPVEVGLAVPHRGLGLLVELREARSGAGVVPGEHCVAADPGRVRDVAEGALVVPEDGLDVVDVLTAEEQALGLGGLGHGYDFVDKNVLQKVFGNTAEISKLLNGDPTGFVSQEFTNQNLEFLFRNDGIQTCSLCLARTSGSRVPQRCYRIPLPCS
jgi:hypothetical protein